MLRTIRNLSVSQLTKNTLLVGLVAGAAVLGGCGDEDSPMAPEGNGQNPPGQNAPQEIVLLESTIQAPIAQVGVSFTNVGSFSPQNANPVQVVITPSNQTSNVLVNIGLPNGGFTVNQAEFNGGDANPAEVTVTNPQTGQGHALRIAEGSPGINVGTYTVRVTQAAN
jgi:hypothetical protein